MASQEVIERDLVYTITGCVYEVYKELGAGFLEKVYERALLIELKKHGLHVQQQASIEVRYKGEVIGNYFAELIVNGKVIIEIKAQDDLSKAHEALHPELS